MSLCYFEQHSLSYNTKRADIKCIEQATDQNEEI